jgi:ApbE superfamily uncharacterized protein (UPF0280 family)
MKSKKYQQRFYREWPETGDLVSFEVQVSESDLLIRADKNLRDAAKEALLKYRVQIESYIKNHPEFLTTLQPYPVEPLAPKIIREMAAAAEKAGVGPMAAVAGAVAEFVGEDLKKSSPDIIVENGGDIYLAATKSRRVGLYAGKQMPPVFIEVLPEETPCGICTSSGNLGHSLSFGKADSVTIIAPSAALADAAATAAGNSVQSEADIEEGLNRALSIEGVRGAIISVNKRIGFKGEVRLCE